MEDEFKVSKDLLKTIIVDTRVSILKALENRPMTASELSRFLGKHVTTVSEHLDLLNKSKLVERVERPGRKWIYYKLTREGKRVLHPESYRWIMVLSAVFFVVLVGWFVWTVDAYPGQLFYPIERARESLQFALAPNSLERAKRHIEFAEERLKEAKFSVEKGNKDLSIKMVEEYEKEVKAAMEEIENARKEGMDVIPALESVGETASKSTFILGNLILKAPELKKEIQSALNISIEEHNSAIKKLRNMTGRPYATIPIQ